MSETFSFQAETTQLLQLVTNSIYSNKEIFLRELISNCSDAIDKFNYAALTDDTLAATNPQITIDWEKSPRTLIITDNGIGMNREEVINNIGTIAKSGTRELLRQLKEQEKSDAPEMIGQFGVGFYSCFMVSDLVDIYTRKAGDQGGWHWQSKGDGSYTLEEYSVAQHGTKIVLHLKDYDLDEGLADYTDEWVLSDLIKKYSDFVRFPIQLKSTVYEEHDHKDGECNCENEHKEPKYEFKTINSMKAIWLRSGSDVKDEEYSQFYRELTHDWHDPMRHIAQKAEGTVEYQALLYLPGTAPFDLFYQGYEGGLSLYVRHVKIMDHCSDLLPTYLRFVRGVVDSPDLPLNVSREILQHNRQITAIRKALTKKILDTLKDIKEKEYDQYVKFWQEFGRAVKEGFTSDSANKDRLTGLLLFNSSADTEKLCSLADYVGRMKENQKDIYYMTGESREIIETSPHLEGFKARGYEVLYLIDPVDEIMVQYLGEYEGKKLKSINKGDVELEEEQSEEAKKERENTAEEFKPLIEALQDQLKEQIKEVRLSTRLTNSPACLVVDEHDYSPHIERLLRQSQGKAANAYTAKRIMEINPKHPVIANLCQVARTSKDDARLEDAAALLWGMALLAEGSPLDNPAKFTKLVDKLMSSQI